MSVKTPVGVIFESLKGSWRLKRSLDSALPGFPSGIFEGTAKFSSRTPTAHSVASELLYSEQGELKMENGFSFKANRKYVYRYNADEDKISAWFVKEDAKQNDGREEIDYLFVSSRYTLAQAGLIFYDTWEDILTKAQHDLEMEQLDNGWVGRADHLCNKDMYWAFYDFRSPSIVVQGTEMDVFGIRYKVKGPQKDYTSDTAYQRIFDADNHTSRATSQAL